MSRDDGVKALGFPAKGLGREHVLAELEAAKADDADWRGGRVPLFVFKGDEQAAEIGQAAFNAFFTENALGGARAFKSVQRFEQDIIAMALDLFGGQARGVGFMTTGGSESIVTAVRAARHWARRHGRIAVGGPANIVMPDSGHPAFDKAADLMDIEIRRIPVAADFRADVAAMASAIDQHTVLLLGSAPCFPFGVFDPISELAELALSRGVWCHVDACVGGYLAPFVRELGRPIPAFDFSVPGVCSISADLHKYGFCPKPASTVFYCDEEHGQGQRFTFDNWPSGPFSTATVVGTRAAGAVAGSWAVLRYLGKEGYVATAERLMAGIDRYRAGVADIEGLDVLGEPELAIVAVGSHELDINSLAARLHEKQWVPGLLRRPPALHRMMSMLHVESMDRYLSDLRTAVDDERRAPGQGGHAVARY